jgi:hypothetical protein
MALHKGFRVQIPYPSILHQKQQKSNSYMEKRGLYSLTLKINAPHQKTRENIEKWNRDRTLITGTQST